MRRRVLSVLLVIVLMGSCLGFSVAATGYDVNEDGQMNMKDVLVLRKYLVGITAGYSVSQCDINKDSFVDMKDVLLLRVALINDVSNIVLDSSLITYCPAYNQLTTTQKSVYSFLVKELEQNRTKTEKITYNSQTLYGHKVTFTGTSLEKKVTVNDVKKVFEAIRLDHPEIFYITSGFSYSYVTSGSTNYIVTMSIEFSMPQSQIAAAEEKLRTAVSNIITKRPKTTEFDVEKYYHDSICQICDYDYDTANQTSKASDLSYTAYGCFVNKKAVCTGYAAAMQLLCAIEGIPCFHVRGMAAGGSHEWNVIWIQGEPYYLDVTWDDTDDAGILYTYFNVNDELLQYRTITDFMIPVPKCTATSQNYFVYTNQYVSSNAISNLKSRVVSAVKAGKKTITMKTTASEYTKMIQWVDSNSFFTDVNESLKGTGKFVSSHHYINDDEMHIIQITVSY